MKTKTLSLSFFLIATALVHAAGTAEAALCHVGPHGQAKCLGGEDMVDGGWDQSIPINDPFLDIADLGTVTLN